MAGRPRKASAIRENEGNRSRTAIPPDLPLTGLPNCPAELTGRAAEHFKFVAGELGAIGVVKRLDREALSVMSELWAAFWAASDAKDYDLACKIVARWASLASRFAMTPSDRTRMMATSIEKPNEIESEFLRRVVG